MRNSPLLLLLLLTISTNCWWQVGHMAVSQIAQKVLKTNKDPAYDQFLQLVQAFNNLTDGRSNSFIQAAVWADDIKQNNASYFDNYHFTDIVYDPEFLFISMTDPQKDVNSINVASSCINVLKTNKNAATFQRAFMARYLLHLVGDIHQPLHSVTMYNSTIKKGDQGGNTISIITLQNQTMNAHAYLDSMALQQKSGERMERPLTQKGKSYINQLADSIILQFPASYFGDSLINTISSHAWTVESYSYAVSDVYSFLLKTKQVTPEWQAKISRLCRERVALAGYRLAAAISSIYK